MRSAVVGAILFVPLRYELGLAVAATDTGAGPELLDLGQKCFKVVVQLFETQVDGSFRCAVQVLPILDSYEDYISVGPPAGGRGQPIQG